MASNVAAPHTPLSGVFPVLPTPFDAQGQPDLPGLRRLVRYLLACGVDGITYPGVASEVAQLSSEERLTLTALVIEEVAGRVPVIVGASSPQVGVAVAHARAAQAAGAQAVMIAVPADRPAVAEQIAYFEAVAQAGPLPAGHVAAILLQVTEALVAIHAAGLVHCDLSPRNVMVAGDADGLRVKVLDFGIARTVSLRGGEHHGHDDRTGVHRATFVGVVKVLSVGRDPVDKSSTFGAQADLMTDGGARACAVQRSQRSRHIRLVAGGQANTQREGCAAEAECARDWAQPSDRFKTLQNYH
jgi:hypothetical protein